MEEELKSSPEKLTEKEESSNWPSSNIPQTTSRKSEEEKNEDNESETTIYISE